MGDNIKGGDLPPSLTSCPCLDEGKFSDDHEALTLYTNTARQIHDAGGCDVMTRTTMVKAAAIATCLSVWPGDFLKKDPHFRLMNEEQMSKVVAAMLKMFVDTVNDNKATPFGIKLNSIDLQTFDRPTAEVIPMVRR